MAGAARPSDRRILWKEYPETAEGGCHARIWLPTRVKPRQEVVVMYHGGAFTFGDDADVPAGEVDYVVRQGAVVVSLQYRLAPHYKYKNITEDLLDGYRWVVETLPKEIGCEEVVASVCGWSAGAHSAALVVAYCKSQGLPMPKAMMVTYGLFDVNHPGVETKPPSSGEVQNKLLEAAMKEKPSTGIRHQPPTAAQTARGKWCTNLLTTHCLIKYLYNAPLDIKRLGPEFSPIDLVTLDWPPTYVMIATVDKLIDPAQSYNFAKKLNENNVEVVIAEADMEHGMSEVDWKDTDQSKKDYARWFEQAIKPGLGFMLQKLRSALE